MPAKTHRFWIDKVLNIKSNNPRFGEGRIQAALEQIATSAQVPAEAGSPPVGATIRRIVRREWDPLSEADRGRYREARWPESFERGDLPWEAAPAVLELTYYDFPFKPDIQRARWFWRVTQAVPNAPLGFRQYIATMIHARRTLGWELPFDLQGAMTHAVQLRALPPELDDDVEFYSEAYTPDENRNNTTRWWADLTSRAGAWSRGDDLQSARGGLADRNQEEPDGEA